MRKINIEFVRSKLAERGYKLLSTEYKGTNSNLDIECPIGHKIKMCWTVIRRGGSCIKCFHDSMRMNIEFIRKEFAKEGYTLLTKTYENSKTRLDYICSRGHRRSTTWGNWGPSAKHKCGICANNVKLNIEFIRAEFAKEGYVLLFTEYDNNKTRLRYRCKRGHHHYTTWTEWQSGGKCPTCWYESITGPGNHNWKGGISKELYCKEWTKELKESIKERDGYKCMNPYCFHKTGHAAELIIHHIDGDKKNCRPENLIVLCRSCHGRVSKDQEWHESWYKAIIYRRYEYKY